MTYKRVEQAAWNNAIWCDTVSRAHGRPGDFSAHLWINRQATPPFYPNAVTLSKQGVDDQLAALEELLKGRIPGEWAVKDSFCTLNLAPLGFRLLFEAEWIYRPALPSISVEARDNPRWLQIRSAAALADWEAAWRGEAASTSIERIFLPPLLTDANVAIFAAYQDQQIVAGAIGNRTGEVVGLSNLFAPTQQEEYVWASCVTRMSEAFPGLPIVGYEAGHSLAQAKSVRFAAIAPLRIWIKEVSTP